MKYWLTIAAALVLSQLMFGCASHSTGPAPAKTDPVMAKSAPAPGEAQAPSTPSLRQKPAALAKAADKRISVRLHVSAAPSDVKALGYEIWFNPKVLAFEKYERAEFLKKGFGLFGANVVAPGKLRMGGAQAGKTPLHKGASGDLAILTFKVIGPGNADFSIQEAIDHIEGWDTLVMDCAGKAPPPGMILCTESQDVSF